MNLHVIFFVCKHVNCMFIDDYWRVFMLWGRDEELKELEALLTKKVSSLVVVTGRRRIGKSTLIQFFAKKFIKNYYEFSGLAPHQKQTNQDQLNHFASQLSEQTQTPGFSFKDWNESFSALYAQVNRSRKPVLIFLDEISWLGGLDPDFPGKLKVAWDTKFKNHPKLLLVLCGSVTSWIDKNILHRADFVGRVSLELQLKELPLRVLHNFWSPHSHRIQAMEKLKILMVTGGVPRYLEEMRPQVAADKEIARLCFHSSGILFNEFSKIFNEIFQKKAPLYEKIVRILSNQHLSAGEIAKKMGKAQNNDLSESLKVLEMSGFISRDFTYLPTGKKTKISRYRLKDNYLRFYLKYIEPIKDKIVQAQFSIKTVDQLTQWNIIAGFQFENLVLNHLPEIFEHLDIDMVSLISASPYIQRKKTRNKGACQIDLLIVCRHKTIYLCEIKFVQVVSRTIISEIEKKIKVFENANRYSIRPVLIYSGEIDKNSEGEIRAYFDKVISFSDLIEPQN